MRDEAAFFFFVCELSFANKQGLSRDIGDLNETLPGPSGRIIVVVEVYEACEREPVFGGWNLSSVGSNEMWRCDKERVGLRRERSRFGRTEKSSR